MSTRTNFGIVLTIALAVLIQYSLTELSDFEVQVREGTYRKACSRRGLMPQPPSRVNTTSRLIALRRILKSTAAIGDPEKIQALLVTSDDDHQSEFVSNYDKRREYISGFSGTKGDAVVTMKKAALWVDGRYHLQANDQIDCNWLLMRDGNILVPSQAQWLKGQFPNGARIGADPKLISASAWIQLEYELQQQHENLTLVQTPINLIDAIWENHNETEEEKKAFSLDEKYAGKSWKDKVKETRQELRRIGAKAMVITALDEIAWLLNIRGRDVPYTRFVKSYVLLSQSEVILFVDQNKTQQNVTVPFNAQFPGVTDSTVKIFPYDSFWGELRTRCQWWNDILVPAASVLSPGASKKIYDLVPEGKRIYEESPIIYLKAVKNPTEIKGMENAHIRDGAAMCKFLQYFESQFYHSRNDWDELRIVKELDRVRLEEDLAVNVSFRTIVAFAENGAQPHYEPSRTTSKPIFDNSTIIIDSGGQYLDGTTDVSRTIHLGEPTEAMKDSYTRVLIGSIQLATLIFPNNVPTSSIDVLARAPIWQEGQDYPHTTGHGVGAFLSVHESPISIHYNPQSIGLVYFKPGYFFSNEPGIYLEGLYGIRLENVLKVVEKPELKKHPYGHTYLGFEDVTLVPYCNKLIKLSSLSVQHRRWLNHYNARIRELVGAELKRQNETDAFYWMMENTKCIPEYGHGSIVTSQPMYVLMNVVFVKLLVFTMY